MESSLPVNAGQPEVRTLYYRYHEIPRNSGPHAVGCNPQQAAKVLNEDMDLNFLLPCRISVYEKDGQTHIGMVRPTALLGAFSDAASLKEVAEEVEAASIKIIDSAK